MTTTRMRREPAVLVSRPFLLIVENTRGSRESGSRFPVRLISVRFDLQGENPIEGTWLHRRGSQWATDRAGDIREIAGVA